MTVLPSDKASKFRWIHLPANNIAWVEALLTKLFLEEETVDVEGFKALERSFSHQHRGQQSHSYFMRPLCQSTPRAPRKAKETVDPHTEQEKGQPIIVINGGPEYGSSETSLKRRTSREDRGEENNRSAHDGSKDHAKSTPKGKGKKVNAKGNKSPKIGTVASTEDQRSKLGHQHGSRYPYPPSSSGRREPTQNPKGNIFAFMPFLHFETKRRQQEMQEAIKRAQQMRSPSRRRLGKAKTYDEMLIRAHLATSTVSLHVRRTLDQFYYHNIDTESRDQDQVVYRYQTQGKDLDSCDPKIVMVDQLWMWILGPNLMLTCFGQRWQQPRNDPLNVLDSIIEDINSKTRDPVISVYDLAMIVTNRCSGVFDRHRMGNDEYEFLDMFESSIGDATDRETVLFKEFNQASAQASAWLQQHRRPSRFSRYFESDSVNPEEEKRRANEGDDNMYEEYMRGPLFLDKLLDIGQETDLLAETKDIRDELNMISKVFEDQQQVLQDLESAICDIFLEEQQSQREVKKRFRDQLKTIDTHLKDIERMDKQAERIYSSITDMLDLKQKHANAFEARFARDQAAGTAKQSRTIMVFTIVTIVFLPLSFIAAFFAINIEEFPRATDGTSSLPLGYVSKYMFGIGFAVSIPLIVIALMLNDINDLLKQTRRRFSKRRTRAPQEKEEFNGTMTSLETFKLDQVLSSVRSPRRSVESAWIDGRLSRETGRTKREKGTGFRIRVSQDVERGVWDFR
jgi:Mg2+ and Co2+ transporter CorA